MFQRTSPSLRVENLGPQSKNPAITRGVATPGSFVLRMVSLCILLWASGCPEEVTSTEPRILVRVARADVEADGVSTNRITITATNGDNEADNRPITVTINSGRLLSEEVEIEPDGLSGRFTPKNGAVEVDFRCADQESGAVNVTARNGAAEGVGTINCIEPSGEYVFNINAEDCADLVASGVSQCRVEMELLKRNATRSFPAEPTTISASVSDAVALNLEDTAVETILSDAEEGTLKRQVSVQTDAQGKAFFYVRSPRLGLAQSFIVEVSLVAPDATAKRETLELTIGPFSNRAAMNMTVSPQSVATGQTTTIFVTAADEVGEPAFGDAVELEVPASSGASLRAGQDVGERVSVVLDEAGFGTAQLTVPTTEDEVMQLVVRARYTPASELPTLERDFTISVYPEEALILNVSADPQRIRSDENETTVVRASLSRFSAGTLQPVIAETVTFRVQAADSARLQFGNRPEPVPAGYSPTLVVERTTTLETMEDDTDVGVATAVVSAQTDRVRGRGVIEVSVMQNGEEVRATAELQLERDPILQSLVFLQAAPANIGVRGSAYPSSSEITFQVLDDLNQPLQNVPVRFDVNATADPESSVQTEAFTDTNGTVTTVLSSGTQAGPISVIATATVDGRTLVTESLPVVVTGGLPAFANSYIICEPTQSAAERPFVAECKAVLVDRFTNRAPANIGVHYRAEGGNIEPFGVTDTQGTSISNFASGLPGRSTASLLSAEGESWSYASVLPFDINDLAIGGHFGAEARSACFDDLSATECDLVSMCRVDLNRAYCSLPPDFVDENEDCWEHMNSFALTGRTEDIGPELLKAIAQLRTGNTVVTPGDESDALTYLTTQFRQSDINALNYYIDDNPNAVSLHEHVRTVVNVYLENQFRCGNPTSCLTARGLGLRFVDHDDCPINYGCIDFSIGTDCPQDGLLSVMAAFRGEESFLDTNGNGKFDYIDVDGNNRHDPGEPASEPWIDMPEPYLDRNNNCIYDDLSASIRLQPVDRVKHSDLFSDVDGSGEFGFRNLQNGSSGKEFTNGQWDRDTELFVNTHLLELVEPVRFEYGQPCASIEVGTEVQCDLAERFDALGLPRRALCVEAGPRGGIAPGCVAPVFDPGGPVTLRVGDSLRVSYRWRDQNGNCYSPGFEGIAEVSSDPAVQIAGVTDATLDAEYCGFSVETNPNRPWCTDQRSLGASLIPISISTNCEGLEQSGLAILTDVTFSLEDFREIVNVRTQCPVCGDGLVEGIEQCDDGNTITGDGCSEYCQRE